MPQPSPLLSQITEGKKHLTTHGFLRLLQDKDNRPIPESNSSEL